MFSVKRLGPSFGDKRSIYKCHYYYLNVQVGKTVNEIIDVINENKALFLRSKEIVRQSQQAIQQNNQLLRTIRRDLRLTTIKVTSLPSGKIDIWLSRSCQKLDIFSKGNFLAKNDNFWQLKKIKFLAIF